MARQYVLAAAAGFFDRADNDLPRVLGAFGVADTDITFFREASRYGNLDSIMAFIRQAPSAPPPLHDAHGLPVERAAEVVRNYRALLFRCWRQLALRTVADAVRYTRGFVREHQFLVDAASVARIARSAKIDLAAAHALTRRKLEARGCTLCDDNVSCEALGCTERPGDKVQATGHRDKSTRNFVCSAPFGHLCKKHRIDAEEKRLSSALRRLPMANGDALWHADLRRCRFAVTLGGRRHVVDATGVRVTSATLRLPPNVAPSQVKILVRDVRGGRPDARLRIGRTSRDTVWSVRLEDVEVLREPVIVSMNGGRFAVELPGGSTAEVDATGPEVHAPCLAAVSRKRSTSLYLTHIVAAHSPRLPTTDAAYIRARDVNAGLPPNHGRRVFATLLSAGTVGDTADVMVARLASCCTLVRRRLEDGEATAARATGAGTEVAAALPDARRNKERSESDVVAETDDEDGGAAADEEGGCGADEPEPDAGVEDGGGECCDAAAVASAADAVAERPSQASPPQRARVRSAVPPIRFESRFKRSRR